ncbi:hypothetical protein A2239_00675 [Candidatus Uhrbacteria bacterium RIFOXYA2_FULL_40_9]|nr:MAG: hypothetical protein UT94_C0006G0008 [Candidatus Uhrbacteria bacterium GW2011_GWF2_40_263]OGL92641.1 MAG: hypothetical protein A2239_00675 [Candidatus Uhrbacteria bacterium RIFOXYA2_FULL_40_9]OGL96713.1 MAG: hypothetical protein A2332_02635 [Candidatus Uhrbacteria bacterium RIFOXYB2_FULL_41_18]HBK34686.1 hypothetical protein [Candidatus Uhrbacteria bacterium]HCB56078.1 hypothetical protein [Candidatus Uhrbacteria bacterium]
MDNYKLFEPSIGKSKAILVILLDAFRWDYLTLEDSPTIFALSQKSLYIKKLVSSSGFTQRTALFTGTLPDKNGFYTMYIRDPQTSPYKILRPFTWILRSLPSSGLLFRIVRKFINQLPKLTTEWAPPGRIPSELLSQISVIEDRKPIQDKGSLPLESIFDCFREAHIPFSYYMAPVSGEDEPTMQNVLAEIKKGGQIFFVQFSDTDGLVHQSGVSSQKRHEVVQRVDARISELKQAMEKQFHDPWIVILGDHGMVDVTDYVDVWNITESEAKKHGLIQGKDYLFFLDSTLARFWFFTEKAQSLLEPYLRLHLSSQGEWIEESYRQSRHIPYHPAWYGDLIWKTHCGIGIFPDFFHGPNDRYRGMHGYDCQEDSQKGMLLFSHKSLPKQLCIESGGIEQICATLCDLLTIPPPKTSTGKSFLKNLHEK